MRSILFVTPPPDTLLDVGVVIVAKWIAIGIAMGIAIGAMYGNIAIGAEIGVALGTPLARWSTAVLSAGASRLT